MNAITAVTELLGPANVLLSTDDIAPYAVDWRGSYRGTPEAVLRPGTTADVAEADFAGSTSGMIGYVGRHRPRRVVLGEPDPDHGMATVLDDDPANLAQVIGLVGRAHHGAIRDDARNPDQDRPQE